MAELTVAQRDLVALMTESEMNAARGFSLLATYERPQDFFRHVRDVGLLGSDRNPRPQPVQDSDGSFYIPYWPALPFLTKVAEAARNTRDLTLGSEVMAVIRALGAPVGDSPEIIDNYHTHTACAEISGILPVECVAEEDIELARLWLSSRWNNDLVVKELDDGLFASHIREPTEHSKRKLARLLSIVTELKAPPADDRYARPEAISDDYWLERLIEHHSVELGRVVGRAAVELLASRTAEVFSVGGMDDSSWLSRAAVEEHDQNPSWDHLRGAIVSGFRDALSAWIAVDLTAARSFIPELLDSSSQIVRRVAIHAINTNWPVLSDIFLSVMRPALFEVGHLHEMYLLLSARFAELKVGDQQSIVAAIIALSGGLDGEDLIRAKHIQRNWLHAIYERGSREADEMYRGLVEELGPLRDHPDLLAYHETSWGPGPSPATAAELTVAAEAGELVDFAARCLPEDQGFRSPRKALLDTLTEAAKATPAAFASYLREHREVPRGLQYAIIRAYLDLYKGAEGESRLAVTPHLHLALDNLARTLSDSAFWAESVEQGDVLEPNRDWIPGLAADVITDLANGDGVPFGDEQRLLSLRVTRALLARSEGIDTADDALTAAINNPRGRAFDAFLSVLLRLCRDADLAVGSHVAVWPEYVEDVEAELARPAGESLEVYALLGSHILQLMYMAEEWVTQSVRLLFPSDDSAKFKAAVTGLAYAGANMALYDLLGSADVPSVALNSDEITGVARERMIERVALAYIWGQEKLSGPILGAMFHSDRKTDLVELVSTISRWADDDLGGGRRERAIALAERCVAFAAGDPSAHKQLLSIAARYIEFTSSLGPQEMAWLTLAAPFAIESHGLYEFTERLEAMAREYPVQVVELLRAAMSRRLPSYDYRDSIQKTLRIVFDAGRRLDAIDLLDRLVTEGGMYQLSDMYEEFRAIQAALN